MKLKTCEVGLFRLPGIVIEHSDDDEVISDEMLNEIQAWSESDQGTGRRMAAMLWSFKTEAQRDWFILRWSGE